MERIIQNILAFAIGALFTLLLWGLCSMSGKYSEKERKEHGEEY